MSLLPPPPDPSSSRLDALLAQASLASRSRNKPPDPVPTAQTPVQPPSAAELSPPRRAPSKTRAYAMPPPHVQQQQARTRQLAAEYKAEAERAKRDAPRQWV